MIYSIYYVDIGFFIIKIISLLFL